MKFYDRTEEIATLQNIRKRSGENAQFTVITGRRRIGKTSLVLKAYEDTTLLYSLSVGKPKICFVKSSDMKWRQSWE